MRNKRLLVIWLTILGLVVVSGCVVAACGDSSDTTSTTAAGAATTAAPSTEQVMIRVTTPAPAGDDLITWAQEGMDRFSARTNGAYKMEIFPGGQLGPFPEMMDAIRTGAIEAGLIPMAGFSGSVPEFGLVELPFLFNNGEAAADAMPSIQTIWDELSQAKVNQRTLGCISVGTLNFLSKEKPLKTLDDLKGLIVGVDAPPMAELVQALGGSGIVVDFTEDYSSLQKGVIDAKTLNTQYIEITKLYEVAKYYTVFHGISGLWGMTINSDVYNSMTADIQNALTEELSATAKSITDKYVTTIYDLEPVLTDFGMEYYWLPPEERETWKGLAYYITEEALANAGEIGSRIKEIVDEANAKYPYIQK
ncbi:MAG: TRAP transporter substrate-binding protein [Actinobacteria bacterium]|nr:TRAP transporter substrate-binding protein [Actinomycetota bacterium]